MALDTRFRRNVRRMLRVAGPVLRPVLRSPAHWLVSHRLLLLQITGRRTGTAYTFPVGYRRDGDRLTVVSANRWWRNLADGPTPVTVWLRGRRRQVSAVAHHGDDTVAAELRTLVAGSPALARMYGLRRGPDGEVADEQVRAAARHVSITYLDVPSRS